MPLIKAFTLLFYKQILNIDLKLNKSIIGVK